MDSPVHLSIKLNDVYCNAVILEVGIREDDERRSYPTLERRQSHPAQRCRDEEFPPAGLVRINS